MSKTDSARGADHLPDEREILSCVMAGSTEYMFIHSLSGNIHKTNAAVLKDLGFSEQELFSADMSLIAAAPPSQQLKQAWKNLEPGHPFAAEGILRRKDGSSFKAMLTFFSLSSGSEPAVLTMAKNLPEQKAAGEAVSRISFKDPLTGVYTREFFEEEANRLDSDRQLPISIIIGDVNGLGLINAALGNAAGDALLKTTAKLLKRTCRSSDLLARWGGDEFIILLPHTREHDAASIAARIEDIFRENRLKDLTAAPGMTVGYFAKLHRWQDLGNIIKDAEEDMNRKKAAESRKAREDILEGILEFLSQNTPETAEHVASVQKTARFLGRKIGLEEESLEMLERAARFHDLGKAAIQPRILLKTSPLSEEEWEEVRKHAETGFRAAEAAGVFSAAAAGAILSHHERWDGTGYPSGLSGESIPLLSRIICLADSFDIMTRGTPYKPPLTRAEALGEIRAMAGKQFDPVLASILVSEMETSGTDQEK